MDDRHDNVQGLLRRAARTIGTQISIAVRRPVTSLASLALIYLAWIGVQQLFAWAVVDATWTATDRSGCDPEGACWAFIVNRLPQFLFGFYPAEERWRAVLPLVTPLLFMMLVAVPALRHGKVIALAGFVLYPIAAVVLLGGGVLGLEPVSSEMWGGLTLTMLIFTSSFGLALPLGIGLALARTSTMPVLRIFATGFIEFWRGLPLVAILFMSVIMLPLFLPPGVDSPRLFLAMVGITFFASSYLAEVIRGGLNGIYLGQYRAAQAIGFGFWTMQVYIVIPQVLRMTVPVIVNTAISLFKDTTFVIVVGLFDLLNIVLAGLSDPNWIGSATEGYVFVGIVYWLICFAMSRISKLLEVRTDMRRKNSAVPLSPLPAARL